MQIVCNQHIVFTDGTDVGKNLNSWSFPIEIVEES
jgi:hypothetical protein